MKIDLIKQGYSAKVYKKEEKEGIFVYKIQKNYNLHRLECCNLKWLENYNLYCPKLISEGKCNEGYFMKLTYIAGISLDDISWNKENIDRVIKLSKELHSVPLNLQVPIYDKNILEKQFNNNCNFLGSHIKCDEIKKWMKYVECEKKILNERRYNNYIHRDFRSGNLLKTEDGRIGVIDFESCGIGDFLFDVIKLYLEIVNEDTSLAMYFLEKYLDIHGVENRHKALQIVRLYNIMDKVGMLVWLIKKQRKDDTYYMWNLEQIRETLM